MQRTCTQCGSVTDASSRFCTNCGAVQAPAPAQAYRQSWEAPPAQVPPWAQAPNGMYPQTYQYTQNPAGLPGSDGSAEMQAKNLMKIAGLVILGALLLLIVCIALALVIPVPGIRTFFWIVAILLIVIPWIIYQRIRQIVRRTIGNFWRFF